MILLHADVSDCICPMRQKKYARLSLSYYTQHLIHNHLHCCQHMQVYSVLQNVQNGPTDRSAMADDRVRQAFDQATGTSLASQPAQQAAAQRQAKPDKPVEGDCPM